MYSKIEKSVGTKTIKKGDEGIVQGPCDATEKDDADKKVRVKFDNGKVNMHVETEVFVLWALTLGGTWRWCGERWRRL